MGTCLREVETLAFLKVKREEAGLADARFAELASWFYRRSAIGGVDHVCLVFRGGGISLREAMQERASAGAKGSAWRPAEIVAVARGLLEVIQRNLGFYIQFIARGSTSFDARAICRVKNVTRLIRDRGTG